MVSKTLTWPARWKACDETCKASVSQTYADVNFRHQMSHSPEGSAPITVALKALLTEHHLTYRALAERTRQLDPEGRGVTHSYLAGLSSGREHPSRRSLELIASSLEVEPEHFPEYRLAQLRRELNERTVGFDAAWSRYRELIG